VCISEKDTSRFSSSQAGGNIKTTGSERGDVATISALFPGALFPLLQLLSYTVTYFFFPSFFFFFF
jgi:hypothetical protein